MSKSKNHPNIESRAGVIDIIADQIIEEHFEQLVLKHPHLTTDQRTKLLKQISTYVRSGQLDYELDIAELEN